MRKLTNKKQLSKTEWLKGFLFGTDGIFYVVVDTLFYNSCYGEMDEDDFYYTKEQFKNKFINN